MDSDEKSVRAMVRMAVESFSLAFAARHVADADYEEGALNMKMHNVFIAALGPEILYYSALVRSLESSLGSMLEKLAVNIARLHCEVSQEVVGSIGRRQTDFFADEELLIGGEFWNFICRSERGYEIVLDEYSRNARCIVDALDRVKAAYLPGATREGDA